MGTAIEDREKGTQSSTKPEKRPVTPSLADLIREESEKLANVDASAELRRRYCPSGE